MTERDILVRADQLSKAGGKSVEQRLRKSGLWDTYRSALGQHIDKAVFILMAIGLSEAEAVAEVERAGKGAGAARTERRPEPAKKSDDTDERAGHDFLQKESTPGAFDIHWADRDARLVFTVRRNEPAHKDVPCKAFLGFPDGSIFRLPGQYMPVCLAHDDRHQIALLYVKRRLFGRPKVGAALLDAKAMTVIQAKKNYRRAELAAFPGTKIRLRLQKGRKSLTESIIIDKKGFGEPRGLKRVR